MSVKVKDIEKRKVLLQKAFDFLDPKFNINTGSYGLAILGSPAERVVVTNLTTKVRVEITPCEKPNGVNELFYYLRFDLHNPEVKVQAKWISLGGANSSFVNSWKLEKTVKKLFNLKEEDTKKAFTVKNPPDSNMVPLIIGVDPAGLLPPSKSVVKVIDAEKADPLIHLEGERLHKEFGSLVKWVKSGAPIWLWGAPGGGKGHVMRQIAKYLGKKFYPFSVGPTTTEGKIFGYTNAGDGKYVEGAIYQPFKHGGLFMIDEALALLFTSAMLMIYL